MRGRIRMDKEKLIENIEEWRMGTTNRREDIIADYNEGEILHDEAIGYLSDELDEVTDFLGHIVKVLKGEFDK